MPTRQERCLARCFTIAFDAPRAVIRLPEPVHERPLGFKVETSPNEPDHDWLDITVPLRYTSHALRRRRRNLVVPLVLACLASRLVCTCAGETGTPGLLSSGSAAYDTPSTPRDAHACCHTGDRKSASPKHLPSCQHCNHAQLTAPDDVQLAPPLVLSAGALPPSVARHRAGIHSASVATSGRTIHGPPPAAFSTVLRL